MASGAKFGTLATQQGVPTVTATYGSEAADWTTKAIDVSKYSKVAFEGTLAPGFTALQLDLLVLTADRDHADLDAFVRTYERDATDGFLKPALEHSLDLAGAEIVAERTFSFCICVEGLSMIRIAAKIDANAADLTLRYIGADLTGEFQTPNVA